MHHQQTSIVIVNTYCPSMPHWESTILGPLAFLVDRSHATNIPIHTMIILVCTQGQWDMVTTKINCPMHINTLCVLKFLLKYVTRAYIAISIGVNKGCLQDWLPNNKLCSTCALDYISRHQLVIVVLASNAHDSLRCVLCSPSLYLSAVPDAYLDSF